MRDAAAITALLVDVRNVAAHKSVRLEIHVPAEQAALVMEAFGWPTMVNPVPVALARLKAVEPTRQADEPKPVVQPHGMTRRFAEMPFAKQAALTCRNSEFWRFLQERHGVLWRLRAQCDDAGNYDGETVAAEAVRFLCVVRSRSEIKDGTDAGEYWKQLYAEFWAWQRSIR